MSFYGLVAIGPLEYAADIIPPYAFAGGNDDVYRYDRDAATWTTITPNPALSTWHAIAATVGHLWVANDDPTLWHSDDDGDTWTQVTPPGAGGTLDSLNISGSTLVIVRNDCTSSSDNGLYTRPADGSGSWMHVVSGVSANFLWMGDIVGARLWYPINAGTIRHFHFRTPATAGGADTDLATTGAAGTVVCMRGEPSDESVAYF